MPRAGEKQEELLFVESGQAEQPFEWSVGRHASRFLTELKKNKRLVGSRCPNCKKVLIPPRRVCGECFREMKEMVELGDEGTVTAFTVVSFGFVDPETGREKPVPYTWAFIRPDGADNTLAHFVNETDPAKLKPGMRVRAVFEEVRRGHILDIKHFQPTGGHLQGEED